MPVSSQKKRTTSILDPSTSDPSSPVLAEQQVFHQYLRSLAQSAVRIVLEAVMREELDQFIGAAWGESNPKRKGYRNGHYTRDLATATGRLEDRKRTQRSGRPISPPGRGTATAALNRISRDQPHPDVCGRNQHP
jgi:hypothetical protein